MSNLEELNALYRDTLARAEGESANEGSEHKDPDTWLLARGTEGGGTAQVVVPGGADDAAAADAEQAAIAANQALAQLQAAETEAEQLVIDLRARLAEMDDLDTFTQRVNFYRQKQDELETLLGQLNQTRAATEEARDQAQTMLNSASEQRGEANRNRAAVTQEVEANAAQIAVWRDSLGNANNVYTDLEMLGLDANSSFQSVLSIMATGSVGYFSTEFYGSEVQLFATTLMGPEREFDPALQYSVQVTIYTSQIGFTATLCWTAHDENGVYSPMAFEDRVKMGAFDTGWVVRQYVPAPIVYGG